MLNKFNAIKQVDQRYKYHICQILLQSRVGFIPVLCLHVMSESWSGRRTTCRTFFAAKFLRQWADENRTINIPNDLRVANKVIWNPQHKLHYCTFLSSQTSSSHLNIFSWSPHIIVIEDNVEQNSHIINQIKTTNKIQQPVKLTICSTPHHTYINIST